MDTFSFNVAAGAGSELSSVVLGGVLALLGGVCTNGVTGWFSARRTKNCLLMSIRSELRLVRQDLGTAVFGYRDSLKAGTHPTPSVFVLRTPVFEAVLPSIGQIQDSDFVEHIVEAYNSLYSLARYATEPELRSLRDENRMHHRANQVLIEVMKLHNRLCGDDTYQIDLDEDETYSRKYNTAAARLILLGRSDFVFDRDWQHEDVAEVLTAELLKG